MVIKRVANSALQEMIGTADDDYNHQQQVYESLPTLIISPCFTIPHDHTITRSHDHTITRELHDPYDPYDGKSEIDSVKRNRLSEIEDFLRSIYENFDRLFQIPHTYFDFESNP